MLNKRILQLAVPSIISNITVPLLGLVDVAIVGHIGDAAYIGAIAVGSMLFNVIYWLFGFLRMGTSGMTSQALGKRDLAEVLRLLVRSLSIGVGIGVLFFVLQKWLIGCGLWAMSPEADVVELARRYCYVCIAVNAKGKITGVVPAPNGETENYFSYLHEDKFFNSWNGMTLKEAAQYEPDAISGATYSSEAVKETVKVTASRLINKK